ncbi:hypothetical protein GIB67_038619 [Kingdonia uniflora]|uniref:GDSL esterase/lipase n=1 Tax=Kingdonia uniflora TaxID=39325 RepID=A0A7J7NQ74_9MAGN|nr:hypothetical protein GIB67_038619 [Kingdonia uniflora]
MPKRSNFRPLFLVLLHVIMVLSETPLAPALYVFGDSLVDSGNNNFLETTAVANYKPYGIDFPLGPAGRFTNGKTIMDFFAESLGLPYVPAYLSLSNDEKSKVATGVNYASGSAGFLPERGTALRLYSIGSRKFVVFKMGPLGCLPAIVNSANRKPNTPCIEAVNQLVIIFNDKILETIIKLRGDLENSTFVQGNIYLSSYTTNLEPCTFGFTAGRSICCVVGGNGTTTCLQNQTPCADRTKYIYWDTFHPTEEVNRQTAIGCFSGRSPCVPLNINELAQRQ